MLATLKSNLFPVVRAALLVVFFTAGLVVNAAAFQPVAGDFSTILNNRSGQLTVWQYKENPEIYVFDFPGMGYQGRSFNRITQLTEQQSKGEHHQRILTEKEMNAYLMAARRTEANFAYGHDVMVHELTKFFNLADRDSVALYPEEIAIRDFLVAQGMLRNWRGFWQFIQPNVVILAIPQTQEKNATEPMITSDARYAILLHEMAHGEYYTNPYYAQYCRRFWGESMTDNQRKAFETFLGKAGYDAGDGELLVNEMQAYLMFTPDPASFSARKLGVSEQELATIRAAFRSGRPPTRLPLHFNVPQ
ncbi:MAG: hypothetical protein Q8L93_04325 [Rhodocyclaceae bacterium]|nr:hypothetical protein [Rhodocyclaceae bacterium]